MWTLWHLEPWVAPQRGARAVVAAMWSVANISLFPPACPRAS